MLSIETGLPQPEPAPTPVERPALTWEWTGELDAADVEDLRLAWRSLVQGERRDVVVDMAAVTFVDCRVVSFLVTAQQEAGSLVLRHAPPQVRFVLQLLGLAGLFALETP